MTKTFTLTFLLLCCLPFFLIAQNDPIPGGCAVIGPNLVVNPEFEDGNTGFATSFTYNLDYTCSYGDYTIASTVNHDPGVVCYGAPGFNLQSIWAVTDRNDPGNGAFMIVDPCDTAGTACSTGDLSGLVWEQSIAVCPNNTYTFSVFAKNIYFQEAINYPGSDTMPDFELRVNGDTVSGYYVDGVLSSDGSYQLAKQPEADSAVWIQISGQWSSGSSSTALITIRNLVPGSQGNDLAIDGIFFGLCGKDVAVDVIGDLEQCAAFGTVAAVTFEPNLGPNDNWQYFEWYKDGVLVQADDDGTFVTPPDANNTYYGDYYMVAYEDPLGAGCGHPSDTYSITETAGCPATFPVEWLSFSGQQMGQQVQLNWRTASELNNKGFRVELFQDGNGFVSLGFVPGIGNSNQPQAYQFLTWSLPSGTYLFRLSQVDIDGQISIGPQLEISVDLSNSLHALLFPNPTRDRATLEMEVEEDQEIWVELLDSQGRMIRTVYQGQMRAGTVEQVSISRENLAAGLYLVRISGTHFLRNFTLNVQP